jgi:hypothetical protein
MKPTRATFAVGPHVVGIEQLEKMRFRVTVDGTHFASFCSESRARAAGRSEARRLAFAADASRGVRRSGA